MAKSILITGGLGFIFSYVTEYFVKRGWRVIVIDNQQVGSHPEIIDGSFTYYNMDMADPAVIPIIVQENPHYIVHAAAITDVDYSIKHPDKTISNNVQACINLFEAARKLPEVVKLLYVNTDEVYGECEIAKTEEDLMFPRNPYSSSKAMCSYIRTSYDLTYQTLHNRTLEIRMCNIFGKRQDTRKIIPLLMDAVKNGGSIPLQEKGIGYREYLYVKNVPEIIELVMLTGDRVYNVTNMEGFTVNHLVSIVENKTGKKIHTYPASRPSHDRFYRMNNQRLKDLGWKPKYTFEQGLREYLND